MRMGAQARILGPESLPVKPPARTIGATLTVMAAAAGRTSLARVRPS